MVLDECSICMTAISDDNQKILSCNHSIHLDCYIDLVRRKNLYVHCPLCRCVNISISKPYDNSRENILHFITNKNKKKKLNRCICNTKDGYRCKNTAYILNYGMCFQHNKYILKKEYYPLMEKYIYLILSQRNNWLSKIYLLDIGKKLIIKTNNIKLSIDELLLMFYEFFSVCLYPNEGMDYNRFYDYYNLEKANKEWIIQCNENYQFY